MPTLIIVDFFQKLSIDSKIKCLRVHSYLYDLAHPATTTYGNFLQSAHFFSVTGEINFITPEGCGCDKGKFGLLHNTQDFLGGI